MGGGVQKIMCPHEHYERETELAYTVQLWGRVKSMDSTANE